MNIKNYFLKAPSYIETRDPMLAARIVLVWANGHRQSEAGGVKMDLSSYLIGLIDAFSMAGEDNAAKEVSFLLELYQMKLQARA